MVNLGGMTIEESNALKDADASKVGYVLYDLGEAKHSPADLGYQR